MKKNIYQLLNILYFIVCAVLTIKIYIWFEEQIK